MKPNLVLIKAETTEEKIESMHKQLDMKKARAKARFELIKRLYGKKR